MVMIRDLQSELQEIGFSKRQAQQILNWTEALPVEIYTAWTSVDIKQGIVIVKTNFSSMSNDI